MTRERELTSCHYCDAEMDRYAEICPKCGLKVSKPADIRNPGISAILSALVPGLGQIYNGQTGKGLVFLLLAVILFLSIGFLVGIVLYPLFWMYAIYDAYESAKKINTGELLPD
ncbi:MAG TPA: hypothetical protein VMW63_10570 [Methanoregulaceae archaeon]|nr:hypothetical protein [Methanoregulaceae archaeon]